MAKIADLLVNLTVETASFRRDLNTARSDMKAFGEGITGTFGQLQRIATTGLQAFGVAMAVNFVKSTSEGIDALGKLSQKIGIAEEDLSTLKHSAELSDLPLEGLSTAVGFLSKALAGFENEENKGAVQTLKNLGINALDANGKLRPTKDVLFDLADAFAGMEDGAQKTAAAISVLGRSGKDAIPWLNGGSAAMRRDQEEARAFGNELDKNTIKAAEQFNDNLKRLDAASKGLAQTLVSELLPSLNRISDGLVESAKSGDKFSSIQAVGKTLDFVIASFSTIVSLIRIAVDYVGMFIQTLGAAGQLLAKGDFTGLVNLDKQFKQHLFDPFKDAGAEIQGIWATSMNGIQQTTESALSTVDKQLNAIRFGLRNGISQLSGGLSGNKEANAVKAARDEYAQTISQLSAMWSQFGERRVEIEQLVLEAVQLRDAKIADATKESTEKRIAAAKRYAEELARANATLDDMSAKLKGELDPFDKIAQDYGQAIDKLTAIWNKYPETRARIEDLILAAVKARDKAILDEEQKTLDETSKLIAKHLQEVGPQLQNVPNLPKTVIPTLDTSELSAFYARAVQQLAKFGTDAEKELEKIFKVDRIEQSIDELILRTGTAAQGVGVFFRQYAKYATDTALVVHDAFARVFGALEDQLTNLLAHFKFDFKSLLDTIKESIARAVVQREILGPLAKALGKLGGPFKTISEAIQGPPDGSKDKPFHVIVDSGGGGLFGGLGGSSSSDSGDGGDGESSGGVLGKLQTGMGKVFSAIGSFFKAIGSAILSAFKFIGGAIGGLFGGFKADGGDVFSGKAYVVGERGPEIFAPGRSGTIIPNHALGSARSANITNNFYLTPTRSDPFGYSESQLANATFTGLARGMSRA